MRGARGAAAGVALLLAVYALTGLLLLGRGEVAVVLRYDPKRVRSIDELILFIYRVLPESGVETLHYEDRALLSTPLGRFYWHPPKPFYVHYKFKLRPREYELRTTVILPLATDEGGRLLLWSLLTKEGFKTFSLYDYIRDVLSGRSPYEGLEVPIISIDGRYRVVDVDRFIEAYRVEENETYRYPWLYPKRRGHSLIGDLLGNALQVYVMNKTYSTYRYVSQSHPDLTLEERIQMTYEIISSDLPAVVEGFEENPEITRIEERYGIEVSRELQIRIEYITP